MSLISQAAFRRWLVCIALGVALVVAGCGDSSNSRSSSDGGSSKAEGTKDQALYDALPDRIRSRRVLRVSTDATLGRPFGEQSGSEIIGLDADLARELSALLGLKLQLANVPFDGIIPGLQADRADVSISSMLDTKERQKVLDFVDFFRDGSGFLVKAGGPLTDLALGELCGKSGSAGKGSLEALALQDESKKCKAAGKPPVDVELFSGVNTATLATISGRVDFYAGSASANAWVELQNKGKLQRSGEPFGVGIVGMAVPKDSELGPVLQKSLQKLMDDGTYADMLKKYNLQDTALEKATMNHALF